MKPFVFLLFFISGCTPENSRFNYLPAKEAWKDTIDIDRSSDLSTHLLRGAQVRFLFKLRPYVEGRGPMQALQVAAQTDEAIFHQLVPGKSFDEISFLTPGTGMAPETSGKYEDLFLDSNAHHYIIFNPDEPTEQRAVFIQKENDLLHLQWTVSGATQKGKFIPFTEKKIKTLFLAFVIDVNLNRKVEAGEFKRIKLVFQ